MKVALREGMPDYRFRLRLDNPKIDKGAGSVYLTREGVIGFRQFHCDGRDREYTFASAREAIGFLKENCKRARRIACYKNKKEEKNFEVEELCGLLETFMGIKMHTFI